MAKLKNLHPFMLVFEASSAELDAIAHEFELHTNIQGDVYFLDLSSVFVEEKELLTLSKILDLPSELLESRVLKILNTL